MELSKPEEVHAGHVLVQVWILAALMAITFMTCQSEQLHIIAIDIDCLTTNWDGRSHETRFGDSLIKTLAIALQMCTKMDIASKTRAPLDRMYSLSFRHWIITADERLVLLVGWRTF